MTAHHRGTLEPQCQPAEGDLEAGGAGVVPDEGVRQPQAASVGGTAGRHAEVGEPSPAEILNGREGTWLEHLDTPGGASRGGRLAREPPGPARAGPHWAGPPGPVAPIRSSLVGRLSTARNRTRMPGASSAGGSRSGSHSRAVVRPSSRQPPGDAAG